MINQENIAAAQLAQIFGSELLRVDEFTTQQSNMTGPAVKMDPRQFLSATNNNSNANLRADERRIMDVVNREAEMSYPKYDEPTQQAPQPTILPQQQTISPIGAAVSQSLPVNPNQMEFSFPPPGSPGFELFEKINKNLERIAIAIETVSAHNKKSFKL